MVDWGGCGGGSELVGGGGGGGVADCNFEHDGSVLSVALMNKFNGMPTGCCRGLCKCDNAFLAQIKFLL